MASRSIGELSAKVTANASQFISEFQRADNVSRRSAANIDREVDKLTKGLKKKFSASDIGKDVLKGLGIGSGFALAEQAAEKISDYWRDAAESAKSLSESSDRQLASTLELIKLRQSDDQQLATMLKEQTRLQKQLAEVQSAKFTDKLVQAGRDPEGGTSWKNIRVQRELNDAEKLQAQNLATELQQLAVKIETARQKITGEKTKESDQKAQRLANEMAAANEWRTRSQLEYSASLEKEAETLIRSLNTPQEEHAARLRRIETLYQSGKLTVEQYTRALTDSFKKLDTEEMKNVEEALDSFFTELDKRSTTTLNGIQTKASEFDREMAAMWNNVSDRAGAAFADMVLTGEASFSELANIVARSMLEIVARMAIINPLLNFVFGGSNGWSALPSFFGGGKAAGGAVEPGYTYRVNENGQEFFKPSVGGTIMPVGASKGLRGNGGGVTYAPVYNVAAGVTRSDLLPILREHGRTVISSIQDAMNRGRPLAASYA